MVSAFSTIQYAIVVTVAALLLALYPPSFTSLFRTFRGSIALRLSLPPSAAIHRATTARNMTTSSNNYPVDWEKNLEALPATPEKIPVFFFAHGSPVLAFPERQAAQMGGMGAYQGPIGPLAQFLKKFGPTLLEKYQPKGIVVFSAHWETYGERLGECAQRMPMGKGLIGVDFCDSLGL